MNEDIVDLTLIVSKIGMHANVETTTTNIITSIIKIDDDAFSKALWA